MSAIRILYQDEELLVASKPGGLLMHRTGISRDRVFFMQQLRDQLGGAWVYPVHRLDRATSGVVAVARSSEAARALQAAMQADACEKHYLAFVRGRVPPAWSVARPLKNERGEPQPALTHFARLLEVDFGAERYCSLVRARLHAGRRHQVRRHLARDTYFILGDSAYGKGGINRHFREAFGLPRLCLHACRLQFPHPRDGRLLVVEDPLPDDLRGFLLRLPGLDEAGLGRALESAPGVCEDAASGGTP
ncbi:MAG TPA: pseudouridine synthase [Myxococcota bacterium]|nr:pseudouridine synthase [Myxococcota bacterium]HRY92996.1 pseudouridine synthase [Myxococcota bacterium]HSA21312.1 pseudouridine synthase [Myxococcota bacterium]